MRTRPSLILSLAAAACTVAGMLLFYSTLAAAPPVGQAPFVDATVQREEMLRELRAIRELLKEQNSLLKDQLQKNHGSTPAKR